MSTTPMQVHFSSHITSSSESEQPRSEDERIGKYSDSMQRMIADLDSTRKGNLDQAMAEKEVAEAMLEELEERITDLALEERKTKLPPK